MKKRCIFSADTFLAMLNQMTRASSTIIITVSELVGTV